MIKKRFLIAFMMAFTLPLVAAEIYTYDPHKLSEEKIKDSLCGPAGDQACFDVLHDGVILLKRVPQLCLDRLKNKIEIAKRQRTNLRCSCNPLDLDLKSPTKFDSCFYTVSYPVIADEYDRKDIELVDGIAYLKNYFLIIDGSKIKINNAIYERLSMLKISAKMKKCRIYINLGFLNPLPESYSVCDIEENIKLGSPEPLDNSMYDGMIPSPVCTICQDKGADLVLIPCGHICTHSTCFQKSPVCPLCRAEVKEYYKVSF